MKLFQKYLSVLVLLLLAVPALAHDTIPVLQPAPDVNLLGLGGEVGVLHDRSEGGPLSIDDVIYAPTDLFKLWRKERFQFGFTSHPVWFRLDVADTIDRQLVLEMNNPYLDEVRCYIVSQGEIIETYRMGSSLPYGERKGHNLLFPFHLPAGDTLNCFIQVPYVRSQLDFKLFLSDAVAREKTTSIEFLILTIFFSLIFVYLLVLGIAIYLTRLKYFWFYFLYVMLVAAYIFADMGLGFAHVWGAYPYLQQVLLPVLSNAYLIAGGLFVMSHFHTWRSYPFHDQALRMVMIIAGCLIPVSMLMPLLKPFYSHLTSYFTTVTYIVTCLLFFWLAFSGILRRDRIFPGWLLVGFLIHGLNVIYSGLENFSIVPALSTTAALAENGLLLPFHTPIVLLIGLLVEMVIVLFIGIRRFKHLYAESQRVAKVLAYQRQKNLNALGLGMETEQQRIAQELHDGLGGGLSAVKFKLERLIHFAGDRQLAKEMQEAVDELTDLHRDLRDMAHNLMPKPLYKLGLLPAVEQVTRRMEAANPNLKIHLFSNVELAGANKLARIYLFRIVQELLNNLFKHAEATEAWLQFVTHDENLLITLEDNGKGFDLNQVKGKNGIGMANIRYRVEDALGGTFNVESAPGKGTMVSIEIPKKGVF